MTTRKHPVDGEADAQRRLADLHAQVSGLDDNEAMQGFVSMAHALKERGLFEDALLVARDGLLHFTRAAPTNIAEAQGILGQALHALGRLEEARAAHTASKGLAEQHDATALAGSAEFALGSVAQSAGDTKTARQHYAIAFRILHRVGDLRSLVQILLNLATMRTEAGEFTEADELLTSALSPLRALRDPYLTACWHGIRGNLLVAGRHYAGAIPAYQAALRYAKRSGAGELVLSSFLNLGSANLDNKQPRVAYRWYKKGLLTDRSVGAPVLHAQLERGAAGAARAFGRSDLAAVHLRNALELSRNAGLAEESTRASTVLASLAIELGDLPQAERLLAAIDSAEIRSWSDAQLIALYWQSRIVLAGRSDSPGAVESTTEQALAYLGRSRLGVQLVKTAAQQLGKAREFDRAARLLSAAQRGRRLSPRERAWENAQAGALLLSAGGPREAAPFLRRAAKQYRQLKDKQMFFASRNDLANAYADYGRHAEAAAIHAECLRLGTQLGDRVMIAQSLMNSGEALRRLRRPKVAVARLTRAANLYDELNDTRGRAAVLGTLGLAFADLGEKAQATESLAESRSLAKRIGDDTTLAVALGGLATLARDASRFRTAIKLYSGAIDIEREQRDVQHELESQAGILIGYAALGNRRSVELTVRRLDDLAGQTGDPSVMLWGLREAAEVALVRKHERLAIELFALWVVVPFVHHQQPSDVSAAVASNVADVVLRLARHDEARVGALVRRVERAVERHAGSRTGSVLHRAFATSAEHLQKLLHDRRHRPPKGDARPTPSIRRRKPRD